MAVFMGMFVIMLMVMQMAVLVFSFHYQSSSIKFFVYGWILSHYQTDCKLCKFKPQTKKC